MIPALALAIHFALTPYDSPEAAAHDALIDAADCSHNTRECGGAIYRYDLDDRGKYFYSLPVTSDKSFGVNIPELAEPAPEGFTRVADYHVHICNEHNKMFAQNFSPADAAVDTGFHLVGYMMDLCTGNIHRFDPDESPYDVLVVRFKSGKELELPYGHVVGWIDFRRYL